MEVLLWFWALCVIGLIGVIAWDVWRYPYCPKCGRKTSGARWTLRGLVCNTHGPIRSLPRTRRAGHGRKVTALLIALAATAMLLLAHAARGPM